MSQLIETRESLAEMKAQQSVLRQEQRVFSYEVHKEGSGAATASNNTPPVSGNTSVASSSPDSKSAETSTASVQAAHGTTTQNHQASKEQQDSFSVEPTTSSDVRSASTEIAGRTASRIRPVSEDKLVRRMPNNAGESSHATPARTASGLTPAAGAAPPDEFPHETDAEMTFKFEAENGSRTATKDAASNIEEEISFEPISSPKAPDDVDETVSPVPAIEPISYSVEETVEESSRESVSEEVIVEFAPWDQPKAPPEAPASLPELSIEEKSLEKSVELPTLSLERESGVTASIAAGADAAARQASGTSNNSGFVITENKAAASKNATKSRQTREQLAAAFAAVRGLPPEDLFADPSIPFVTPIEPAEPVATTSSPSRFP
ncbi:MAG: hypothetical protein U0936_02495 [Planctomycetaceae bacterium]